MASLFKAVSKIAKQLVNPIQGTRSNRINEVSRDIEIIQTKRVLRKQRKKHRLEHIQLGGVSERQKQYRRGTRSQRNVKKRYVKDNSRDPVKTIVKAKESEVSLVSGRKLLYDFKALDLSEKMIFIEGMSHYINLGILGRSRTNYYQRLAHKFSLVTDHWISNIKFSAWLNIYPSVRRYIVDNRRTHCVNNESTGLLPNLDFRGKVVVASTPKEMDEAVKSFTDEKVLGFDTETKNSNEQKDRFPDLVQLASHEKVVLLQMSRFGNEYEGFPIGVKKLLEDESIVKVGVGINEDMKSLEKGWKGLRCKSGVDLGQIANHMGIGTVSLKSLTGIFLSCCIEKKKELTMSNSGKHELSDEQIEYAAINAWVGHQIYYKILYLFCSKSSLLDKRKFKRDVRNDYDFDPFAKIRIKNIQKQIKYRRSVIHVNDMDERFKHE